MTSYYHFLAKEPYLNQKDIPVELEVLASKLLKSGLLRIDGDEKRNFVRFKSSNIKDSRVFTKRELYDPRLLNRTKRIISQAYQISNKIHPSSQKLKKEIVKLRKEMQKHFPITPILEKKIARLIVQMAESVVIELAIFEEVEIFFSYSYMIGDVMDIYDWKMNGTNSGMQSFANTNTQIFITSGGDPFLIEKEQIDKNSLPSDELTYGPGKPALARAIIIGAQEFGHYADIIRIKKNYVGRHSGDLYLRFLDNNFNDKRVRDIKNIHNLYTKIKKIGFEKYLKLEEEVKFYDKNRLQLLKHKLIRILFYLRRFFFLKRLIKVLPQLKNLVKYKYTLITTKQMFEDMLFNLEPKADVYSHSNKKIEAAIACAEALARVPQQAKKWGDEICSSFYKELYFVYFEEVIPKKVKEYRELSGDMSYTNITNYTYISKWQRQILNIKSFIR